LCGEYRSLSSSLYSYLQSPISSSLLRPIFFSTPYSQTLSAYVPPSMWATKFHTNSKQQAKLYICISLIFEHQTGRQRILHGMLANIPWLQSALNFLLNRIYIVKVVPKYLNSSTLSEEIL
jgi:hypothetical protein